MENALVCVNKDELWIYHTSSLGWREAYLLVILWDSSSFEATVVYESLMKQELLETYRPQVYYR
jgi:hypothetical protein